MLFFIEPLREYLSRHGCVTHINSQTIYEVTYLIIVGDSEFVKGIIASEKTRGEKTLAIIYEGGENDTASYIAKNIHVAIIDPSPLNEDSLRALLLLLFTGSARSLISRKAHTFKDHKVQSRHHRDVSLQNPSSKISLTKQESRK